MLTAPEEKFHHLVTCISRLHSALETLRTIKACSPDNPLIPPAFRFALVEYATAFTNSRGQLGKHKLDSRYVPPHSIDLHERIVSSRDQVHAHSDLTIMNAEFKATGTKANPTAEMRGEYVDELKEFQNLDQIATLISESIHSMCIDQDSQLKALRQ